VRLQIIAQIVYYTHQQKRVLLAAVENGYTILEQQQKQQQHLYPSTAANDRRPLVGSNAPEHSHYQST